MDFLNFIGDDTGNFDVDIDTDGTSTENPDYDGWEEVGNETDHNASFPSDNYDWIDNYVYFGNQEIESMNMDTTGMEEHHHTDDHKNHSSQISFKGLFACTHSGCRCGGYEGRDSGNICMCTHSYFEHIR